MIYGGRVRQMREIFQLTQSELAAEVGDLTQSQLSRIESDQAPVDSRSAAVFSAIFGMSEEFFRRRPTSSLSALTPQMRSRGRLTKIAKNSALGLAHLVLEEYVRLHDGVKAPPTRVEPLYGMTPDDAARTVRGLLGFTPAEPLPYLLLAAERAGVRVLGLPLTLDALDAFCVWHDGHPTVAILADAPGDRLRFSVAHEIGHLVLHDGGRSDPRQLEDEANRFAAELLTPGHVLADLMPRNITLRSLTMVKTQWGVSVKSLVRTARELNLIDQQRAVSLYRQMSARKWNRSEPGYVPSEKPRAFRKLAELRYGPGPNTQLLAAESGWPEDLVLAVLEQHATEDELPFESGPATHFGNVVTLSRRTRAVR
jgi:Zn-dependent peptidase ImmA (M78 family)/transcriptional regulator with XRE-family HTH domain